MNVAVSACLMGEACRYDARSYDCEVVPLLQAQVGVRLIALCPEQMGGLSTPRTPCEILSCKRALHVVDARGTDYTDAFMLGAQRALKSAQEQGCKLAILKSHSPSCGSGSVYDGSFSGRLVPGFGATARLLRINGIRVIDERQLAVVLRQNGRGTGQKPPLFADSSAECPVLQTDRLVLRPLTLEDVDALFAYCSDSDIAADAGWPVHRTKSDTEAFIRDIASRPHVFGIFRKSAVPVSDQEACAGTKISDGDDGVTVERKSLVVGHAQSLQTAAKRVNVWEQKRSKTDGGALCSAASQTGACIGSIGLIPDLHRCNVDCSMLAYSLAKEAWGHGYATEAAHEVLRYGFGQLLLQAISCTHYSFNKRSRRVIEKCGFTHEGTLHGVEQAPDGTTQDVETYWLESQGWDSRWVEGCP